MNNISKPEELIQRIQGVSRWTVNVTTSKMITPRMRHIQLQSPELQNFTYLPGQDIMLWVPTNESRMLYRRYTIRHFDPATGTLDLNIFAHGQGGPGEHWVQTVQPGDSIEIVGPRGKITPVPSPWYLFAGDETYIPATLAMLESLPASTPAWAFLEVTGPQEELPLKAKANVHLTWIHRGDTTAGDPTNLLTAIASAELPTSPGHAYIGAELQVARTLHSTLETRGFDNTRISSKAY